MVGDFYVPRHHTLANAGPTPGETNRPAAALKTVTVAGGLHSGFAVKHGHAGVAACGDGNGVRGNGWVARYEAADQAALATFGRIGNSNHMFTVMAQVLGITGLQAEPA